MAKPEFYSIGYSPWSERAAFAIDVSQVDVHYKNYAVYLDEISMRRKIKKWRGNISMPCLILPDGTSMMESVDIARWANQNRNSNTDLFPHEHEAEITTLVAQCEDVMQSGRVVNVHCLLQCEEALRTYLPKPLRNTSPGLAFAKYASRRTLKKYGALERDPKHAAVSFKEKLSVLEARLSDKDYLFDTLTFADIVLAQCVAFVKPASHDFVRMSRIAREKVWESSAISNDFDALVSWRDGLYERHRSKR